jgi:hypothetical protein
VASPWATIEYWAKLREPDFSEYIIEGGRSDEAEGSTQPVPSGTLRYSA